MNEPEYLPMGERGWIVEGGSVDIDFTGPGTVIQVRVPQHVTPIFLPSTKFYPIEDEL